MLVGSTRKRRLRSRRLPRHDRRLRGPQPQHLPAPQSRQRPRAGEELSSFRIPDDARKRQGFPAGPRLLQAQPPRPEHDDPVGVLHLAGRDLPGRHRTAHLPVRHGADRRRLHQLSAATGLLVPGGRHGLAGRHLPRLRRRRRRNRLRPRLRRRAVETTQRSHRGPRPDPRRDQRLGRQQ